ncbi:MAG: hypothetical protein RJA52_1122 [Bacteroidota bacterium]
MRTLLIIIFGFLGACQMDPIIGQNQETLLWTVFEGKGKRVVLISGDEEYRSEEALPQLAAILSKHHGFHSTVLYAQDPNQPGTVNPNYRGNIPGLEALEKADLMIIFTRFRSLPDDQMKYIEEFLMQGKPVLAIRTATHAFEFGKQETQYSHWSNFYDNPQSEWDGGFGRLVLGERWYTHHGHHKHQSTRGIIAEGVENHPIWNGIENGKIWGSTDVYGVRLPLPGDIQPLVLGQVINRQEAYDEKDIHFGMSPKDNELATNNPAEKNGYNPNDPLMPIVWTKTYTLPKGKTGKSLTSTIGSSSDLLNQEVRRLLVNGVFYLLKITVPEKAEVGLIGTYNPSQYNFHSDEYWKNKNLRVSNITKSYR